MSESEIVALLREHHDAAWGWALSCSSGSRDDAEDLMQTVYLKVLDGRARYDGRAAFRTWLFSVIRKTAIDAARRCLLRRFKLFEMGGQQRTEPHHASTEATELRSHLRRRFTVLMASLSPRQREILHLVFYQGLAITEAAGVMGVSVGSARTHYERGKKRLRTLIENESHDA